MKQFIKTIFLFLLLTCITYPVLLFLWGITVPQILKPNINYNIGYYGHLNTRLTEVKSVKNIDILFLGSSHAYRGFDTRIFKEQGFKSFNLGSSAQTPYQSEVLLKRYLNQLNPRVVIYDVYPAIFSNDGVESSLDVIGNDRNDFLSFKMALYTNHLKVYNTLIYGILADLFNIHSTFTEPRKKDKDTYVPNGYVEREIASYHKINYPGKKSWEFNGKMLRHFNNNINMILKKNTKLILVNAPITPSLYRSYLNNNMADSILSSYGDYYNFNTILNLDDSLHFYDSDHLNQTGVRIFNQKLVEIVNQKLAAPSETSSWRTLK